MRRLLIIDDELLIRKYLKRTLSEDFEVITLSDPTAAMQNIKRYISPTDFILCDYMMDHATGLEFFDYLVKIDYFEIIQNNFCFMTAYEDDELFNKIIPTGCRIVGKNDLNHMIIKEVFLKNV